MNPVDKLGLYPHQEKVLERLSNGRILFGPMGSGKTITTVGYYLKNEAPKPFYVITTAKVRDSLEWHSVAAKGGIGPLESTQGALTVDSWNNIQKYIDVEDAFFVFDEQRLVGSGAWVKAFYKIARKNNWIMLSATPGDVWMDYAPVMIANGYYKNITDFRLQHVRYGRHKFPKIIGYLGVRKLERIRNELLVEMEYPSHTHRHLNLTPVNYDKDKYKALIKNRWNPWSDQPMVDAAELVRCLRRLVIEDPSRLEMVRYLLGIHPALVVFYNFNYELDLLRGLADEGVSILEWNGHKKDDLPSEWTGLYLVQYVAGAEGWNCTSTDAMIFHSMTYSYKNFMQSQGRIDRLNTSYVDLYYYILDSGAPIDRHIWANLTEKKNFNEKAFIKELENDPDFEDFSLGFYSDSSNMTTKI